MTHLVPKAVKPVPVSGTQKTSLEHFRPYGYNLDKNLNSKEEYDDSIYQ